MHSDSEQGLCGRCFGEAGRAKMTSYARTRESRVHNSVLRHPWFLLGTVYMSVCSTGTKRNESRVQQRRSMFWATRKSHWAWRQKGNRNLATNLNWIRVLGET